MPVQTCLGLDEREADRRASPQGGVAVQTNKLATFLVSCHTARDAAKTREVCLDKNTGTGRAHLSSFLADRSGRVPQMHSSCKINICIELIWYDIIKSLMHDMKDIFLFHQLLNLSKVKWCLLYSRAHLLWRFRPTVIREYLARCRWTSMSAMARGRGANTSASPTCSQMVSLVIAIHIYISSSSLNPLCETPNC